MSAAPLSWDLVIVATVACVLASAFFSGTETGLISVSRVRLRHAGRETLDRRVDLLMTMLERLEEAVLTCLIGNNLTNVLAGALMTAALAARYPRGELMATAIVSGLLIVFGEIVPKVLYREYPEQLTVFSVRVLRPIMFVLAPARWLLRAYSGLWRRVLPAGAEESAARLDPRGLSTLLLANVPRGDQERRFRQSLTRFLQLGGADLRRLARPMQAVVSVPRMATVARCLQLAADSGYSRLAVLDEDGEGLAGWLAVRDLLFLPAGAHDGPVPPTLVRTSLLVDARLGPYELLEELHGRGQKLAFVVDAEGRPLGMITLEDLIETVVGSIRDEFDRGGEQAPAA